MALTYKILGQSAPSATTETTLYTVPALTSAVISSVIICNRGGAAGTFRISLSQGGGATANKDYLYYDLTLAANDTFIATVGLTLATTDVARVYASSGDFSFSLYGSEIT